MNFAKLERGNLLPQTKSPHQDCKNPKKKYTYCTKPSFLDSMCQNGTFHISKTVRLGLSVASELLEDPNVKIIFVARDPRGNY